MTTFILPGFSKSNDGWAKDTPNNVAIRWRHWDMGITEPDWIGTETNHILDLIANQKVNILAKSIGTLIAMKIMAVHPELINKIILNGIPINDFHEGDETFYHPLKNFSADKALVFQNATDPHGSFSQAEELIHSFNPEIKVLETPRSDHEYPFYQEFNNFLTDV